MRLIFLLPVGPALPLVLLTDPGQGPGPVLPVHGGHLGRHVGGALGETVQLEKHCCKMEIVKQQPKSSNILNKHLYGILSTIR